MSDTSQDHAGLEPTEQEVNQMIGDRLREAAQIVAGVSNFGYPVPALCVYLETTEENQIVTSEQAAGSMKASMVMTSPVLSLIAYSQQREGEGTMITPEQKDTMRDELHLLDQMLDQVKAIIGRRQQWLGPKEEKKLIVMSTGG